MAVSVWGAGKQARSRTFESGGAHGPPDSRRKPVESNSTFVCLRAFEHAAFYYIKQIIVSDNSPQGWPLEATATRHSRLHASQSCSWDGLVMCSDDRGVGA